MIPGWNKMLGQRARNLFPPVDKTRVFGQQWENKSGFQTWPEHTQAWGH